MYSGSTHPWNITVCVWSGGPYMRRDGVRSGLSVCSRYMSATATNALSIELTKREDNAEFVISYRQGRRVLFEIDSALIVNCDLQGILTTNPSRRREIVTAHIGPSAYPSILIFYPLCFPLPISCSGRIACHSQCVQTWLESSYKHLIISSAVLSRRQTHFCMHECSASF